MTQVDDALAPFLAKIGFDARRNGVACSVYPEDVALLHIAILGLVKLIEDRERHDADARMNVFAAVLAVRDGKIKALQMECDVLRSEARLKDVSAKGPLDEYLRKATR